MCKQLTSARGVFALQLQSRRRFPQVSAVWHATTQARPCLTLNRPPGPLPRRGDEWSLKCHGIWIFALCMYWLPKAELTGNGLPFHPLIHLSLPQGTDTREDNLRLSKAKSSGRLGQCTVSTYLHLLPKRAHPQALVSLRLDATLGVFARKCCQCPSDQKPKMMRRRKNKKRITSHPSCNKACHTLF
jgi:hypothetical protein